MDPMIAYCGVDCSACPDYKSGKCPSCRLSEWKDGDICMPVRCCRDKGIECCAYCPSFPCEDMSAFYAESDSHRAAYERMLSLRTAGSAEQEHRMDKKEFIRRLEKYGFPKTEYMIMSGGSMLMRGLRESTGDFDLCVSEKLAQTLDLEHCPLNDKGYYAPYEDMELTVNLGERPYDIVDGFQCETLESVLEFKKSLMRPKDIKDIEAIERYLENAKENK